jgi:hypothetical protein
MNRQLTQQGVDTKKLPLLHKAVLAAAKAAIPAQRIYQLLDGAQWADDVNRNAGELAGTGGKGKHARSDVADSSSSGGSGYGHVQLAPGADEAYDAAAELVQQQQAEYEQAVAATLAAYSSSSRGFGSTAAAATAAGRGSFATQLQQGHAAAAAAAGAVVQQAILGDAQQGVVCLVVRSPAAASAAVHGVANAFQSNGNMQQQQHGAWVQQLLAPGHVLLKQETLAESEVAAAAGLTGAAAAGAGRGRGSRGRGGRGRGRNAAAAAGGFAADEEDGLLLLQVEVPELACLAQELQHAQQQLTSAASAAVGRASAAFLGSYGMFKAMVAAAAELDVLAGFASVAGDAAAGSFSRPRFAAAGTAQAAAGSSSSAAAAGGGLEGSPVLEFEGLWHPLMGQSVAGGSGGCVAPNDVHLGGQAPTAMLLTGKCHIVSVSQTCWTCYTMWCVEVVSWHAVNWVFDVQLVGQVVGVARLC